MKNQLALSSVKNNKYSMKKHTRGILEELTHTGPRKNSDEFVNMTGNNIIESAINLLTKIHNTYPEDVATDLERRFLSSIKNANPKKFTSGINKVTESRKKDGR